MPIENSVADPAEEDWQSWSKEKLEKQFSPSQWSPILGPDEIIRSFVDKVSHDQSVAKQRLGCSSLPILPAGGSDSNITGDIYGEDLPKDSPILVFVHGGYWQELHKDLAGGLMGPLHDAGVLTVLLPYTTAPKGTIGGMVAEVRRGLAAAFSLARERGSVGVVVSGHSAGGHLVLQSLLSPGGVDSEEFHRSSNRHLKGVVSISGVFDLRPLVNTYVNLPLGLCPTTAWQHSPSNPHNLGLLAEGVAPNTAFLLAVAEHDSPAFIGQNRSYAKELQSRGFQNVTIYKENSSDHFKIISDLTHAELTITVTLKEFVRKCTCKST